MLNRYKHLIYYGAGLAALLLLLRWLEIRLLIIGHAYEFYAGSIALIFTLLGIWIAIKLTKPKKETIIVEKRIPATEGFSFNSEECTRRNISKRELEVLGLMALGFSNAEIATQLFVTMNTIKTHISNLFEKLEVSRRTQAVEKAKRLGLIR